MQGMIKWAKSKLNKHVISQISKKNKGNKKIKTRNSKKKKRFRTYTSKTKALWLDYDRSLNQIYSQPNKID